MTFHKFKKDLWEISFILTTPHVIRPISPSPSLAERGFILFDCIAAKYTIWYDYTADIHIPVLKKLKSKYVEFIECLMLKENHVKVKCALNALFHS